MRKYIRILALMFLIPAFFASAEDSRTLLGEILKEANSLNSNLSIEKRLAVFEAIQTKTDRIVDEFPASDEGIKLLSGQKIGNFDLSKINSDYVEALADYYQTVCTLTPSAECLAFVALEIGSKDCRKASNFDEIRVAQSKIITAVQIFNKKAESAKYKNLALSEFKTCVTASGLTNQAALKDYFLRQLVPVYLDIGEEDQARAVIQQIKEPYLKYLTALELTKYQDGISRDFLRRMSEFVNENFRGTDAVMASYELTMLGLEIGIDPKRESLGLRRTGGHGVFARDPGPCERDRVDEIYQASLKLMEKGALGYHDYVKNNCGNQGRGDALLALAYFAMWPDIKEEFLVRVDRANYDLQAVQNIMFDMTNDKRVFEFMETIRIGGGANPLPFNAFSRLKEQIRAGNLCTSVETLFNDFLSEDKLDSAQLNDLLSYVVESGILESSETCGDASLELLLSGL